jgi:hypothetical protein
MYAAPGQLLQRGVSNREPPPKVFLFELSTHHCQRKTQLLNELSHHVGTFASESGAKEHDQVLLLFDI